MQILRYAAIFLGPLLLTSARDAREPTAVDKVQSILDRAAAYIAMRR